MSWPRLTLLAGAVLAVAGWAWWRFFPDTLPDAVRAQVGRSADANPPLYKWRDAQGQWHITDTPPTDRSFEKVTVDPKLNVVPTVVPGQSRPPEDTAGG